MPCCNVHFCICLISWQAGYSALLLLAAPQTLKTFYRHYALYLVDNLTSEFSCIMLGVCNLLCLISVRFLIIFLLIWLILLISWRHKFGGSSCKYTSPASFSNSWMCFELQQRSLCTKLNTYNNIVLYLFNLYFVTEKLCLCNNNGLFITTIFWLLCITTKVVKAFKCQSWLFLTLTFKKFIKNIDTITFF